MVKSGARSRSDSGDEKKNPARGSKKSKKRRAPSPSTDEEDDDSDSDEGENRSSGIEIATFVPVLSSTKTTSPLPDNAEQSLGVDDGEKGTDESVKKMQEERRAKAKVFLRFIRERDQKTCNVVKTDKPWDDD